MFRIPEHNAVINRLGFNNAGVDALVHNVEKARRNGILGINIGKNKDTPNEQAAEDYIYCMERVLRPGRLHHGEYLLAEHHRVCATCRKRKRCVASSASCAKSRRSSAAVNGHRTPMLLKISPDLSDEELDGMASVLNAARIDGVIVSNTTIDHARY